MKMLQKRKYNFIVFEKSSQKTHKFFFPTEKSIYSRPKSEDRSTDDEQPKRKTDDIKNANRRDGEVWNVVAFLWA